MAVDAIIGRLTKVRAMGPSKWQACCPAHEDRSPSLAVRSMPDGRVLIHCFSGCSPSDVMGALGLTLADLMPERLDDHLAPVTRPWTGDDALRCLVHEAAVVAIVASDALENKPTDLARLCIAAGTLHKALEYVDGIG